jgi:hypothetical protein
MQPAQRALTRHSRPASAVQPGTSGSTQTPALPSAIQECTLLAGVASRARTAAPIAQWMVFARSAPRPISRMDSAALRPHSIIWPVGNAKAATSPARAVRILRRTAV